MMAIWMLRVKLIKPAYSAACPKSAQLKSNCGPGYWLAMSFAMFGYDPRRVIKGRRALEFSGSHQHWYGGIRPYHGLRPVGYQPPVHLLFCFDCHDPLLPVSFNDGRQLPLLSALRYGACKLGYQVLGDSEVRVLCLGETTAWDDFPRRNFPDVIRPEPFELLDAGYNADDPDDVINFGGVFGFDHLTSDQFDQAEELVERRGWWLPGTDGTQSVGQWLRDCTCLPYLQGPPELRCPNSDCPNHDRDRSMKTVAIAQLSESDFPEVVDDGVAELQLIWLMCELCKSVMTVNQCT